MQVPGALFRAERKLKEGATPLYNYIMDKLGGHAVRPLGAGVGALTHSFVKEIQGPGRRGFLDVTLYEPPGQSNRLNKFTAGGAENFTGAYPRHLLTPKGLAVFYPRYAKR